VAHQFKVKRKDGEGWWTLPHMDQDQIDGLIGGEHTNLHHHDDFYHRKTYIDAELAKAVWLDGTRSMTGDLTIIKDQPAIILEDDGGYVIRLVNTDITTQLFLDPTDAVANSGLDIFIDGISSSLNRVLQLSAETLAINANVVITDHYLQIKGDEGTDGFIYLYADDGDDPTSDFWRIRAGDDGLFAIQNWPASSFEDRFIIHPTTGIRVDGLTMDGAIVVDSILDQDDFYSDSDTALATQQSIKAYIDNTTVALDGSRNMTGELEIFNASGGQLLELRDSGASGVNDALVWIRFRYGATTNLGVIGYGSTGDDDFYIQNEVGGIRISAAFTEQLNIQEDSITGKLIKDEDTMSSDSDIHLATQQSIKKYVDDKNLLDLGSILTSNGTYVGTKITVTVDDASAIFGDVLAQAADFHYDRADASAAANSVGLVMALSDGTGTKEVLIEGQVCDTDWDWNAGLLYLSVTTGKMTQSAPATSGDQVIAVGWALSADTIYFKPSLVLAEIV